MLSDSCPEPGDDASLWGVEEGEGNDRSDLTQSVALTPFGGGTVKPNLCTANLLSASEIPGDWGLVALDLVLSTPSGTSWMTPP